MTEKVSETETPRHGFTWHDSVPPFITSNGRQTNKPTGRDRHTDRWTDRWTKRIEESYFGIFVTLVNVKK